MRLSKSLIAAFFLVQYSFGKLGILLPPQPNNNSNKNNEEEECHYHILRQFSMSLRLGYAQHLDKACAEPLIYPRHCAKPWMNIYLI